MHYFGLEVSDLHTFNLRVWWPPRAKSTTKDFLFLLSSSSRALLPKNSILIPLCASAKARWLYSAALFVWTIIGMSMMVISYWVNQIRMIRAAALLLMTYIWRWCDRRSQHWYAFFPPQNFTEKGLYIQKVHHTHEPLLAALCYFISWTLLRGLPGLRTSLTVPDQRLRRIKIDRWSIPDISS